MANPFEGQTFARMGTIYHNFGEMVDSLDQLSRAKPELGLDGLVTYYQNHLLPQFRTWISEETTRTSGFPVQFTHEQLMLDFGDEPSSSQQGAARTPDTSQHASSGGTGAQPIFADVRVRQAIAHAVDADVLRDTSALLNTWGTGYAEHLSTGAPGAWQPFVDEFASQAIAYDVEAAKKLLEEAGWVEGPDGIRIASGALYAGGELLSFELEPRAAELDALASEVARLPGADPKSRAEQYAAIEREFGREPFFSTWSHAVLPYYNQALFDEAGLDYPTGADDWTWEKVAEVAKALTVDVQGRSALDAGFDPNTVVRHGGQWWTSTQARVGGVLAGVVLLGAGGFGAYQLLGGGDGGNDGGTNAITTREGFRWSDGTEVTEDDIRAARELMEAEGWQVLEDDIAAIVDGTGDSFNTFTLDDTYTDPLVELGGGFSTVVTIPAAGVQSLSCGGAFLSDMTVICPPGVSGALPPGDYVFTVGKLQGDFSSRQAGREYRYNVFFQDGARDVIFPEGDPRPEYPYNTLTRTNSYFELFADGPGGFQLNGTWIDVPAQRTIDFSEAGPAQDFAPSVRAAIGGRGFVLFVPVGFFTGPEVLFNVGTNVHAAGVEYAADNVALDVLGETSLDVKPPVQGLSGLLTRRNAGIIDLIKGRLPDYITWVREGNGAEILGHLDASAIDHWGAARCDAYFAALGGDDTFTFDVLDARGPVSWDWSVYGESVGTITDAYEFDLSITQQGITQQATAHFAWDAAKGDIRVFSPCITRAEATPSAGGPSGGAPGGAQAAGPTVDAIRALIPAFELARRNGDDAVYDYLHPVVIAYYGEAVCRDFYANRVGPDPTFAFVRDVSVAGPAAYTYAPGGVTVGTAEDVYSFVIDTTIGGATQPFTWRFALVGGELKTFQPCTR